MKKVRLSRARYRFSALLFILRFLALVASLVTLFWSVQTKSIEATYFFLGSLGSLIVIGVLYLIVKSSLSCPICKSQSFGSGRCVRHRNARRFLLSYTAPVVFDVLVCKKRLRCQYCDGSYRFREYDKDKSGPPRKRYMAGGMGRY